ncbi:MAG: hypothetical protein JO023_02395 [Chloroflexi bacterium]|nr:hypothetical protein [Chloroflexota bacterium]
MAGAPSAIADRHQDAAPADRLARVGQLLAPVLDTWLGLARVAVMLEPGPAVAGEVELWEDETQPPLDPQA